MDLTRTEMNQNNLIENELTRTRAMFPTIKKILVKNAHQIFSFREATKEEDLNSGFDCLIQIENIKIAIRIRKFSCTYRDFTVRHKNAHSVYPCEYEKIQLGKGDLYFYAWVNEFDKINEYMIVDLAKLRESGLMNTERKVIINKDGTCFKALSLSELYQKKCIKIYETLD